MDDAETIGKFFTEVQYSVGVYSNSGISGSETPFYIMKQATCSVLCLFSLFFGYTASDEGPLGLVSAIRQER